MPYFLVADYNPSGIAARFEWQRRIGDILGNTRDGDQVFSAVDSKRGFCDSLLVKNIRRKWSIVSMRVDIYTTRFACHSCCHMNWYMCRGSNYFQIFVSFFSLHIYLHVHMVCQVGIIAQLQSHSYFYYLFSKLINNNGPFNIWVLQNRKSKPLL